MATKIVGWVQIALAALAGYLFVANVVEALTTPLDDTSAEWAPIVAAIMLPIFLSLAWGGTMLLRRRDWLHQAVPVFVFFTIALIFFVLEL